MLFSPSRLALGVTVLAAFGLHAGVGIWLMSPSSGRQSGAADAEASSPRVVTLVSPRPGATEKLPSPQESSSPEVTTPLAALPRRDVAAATASPPTQLVSPLAEASSSAGEPEAFTAAQLPGQPLIPLEDDDAAIAGSLSLRLAIDETGHVVHSEVVSRQGLSDKAVDVFVKAFSGYEYIPARRGGRTVRSEVTMVVGVEENSGESKEP